MSRLGFEDFGRDSCSELSYRYLTLVVFARALKNKMFFFKYSVLRKRKDIA